MIPLKLQIQNFLSYGSTQIIDFSPYRLIYLSGKNGHGKSALLDAITWVVWGHARKISGVSRAEEGLVKLGQNRMMVAIDFICNDQKYRVKREYALTKSKPYVALDFALYKDDKKLISLTEKTIKATQTKIENTIHITLDSFVNSAFLRQGQANEFSKKSPKDRKEIFAQILGLQQYENIKRLAMDKTKQAIIEKENLIKFQEKIASELQQKKLILCQINELQNRYSQITARENLEAKAQKELEKKIAQITEDQKNHQILTFKIDQITKLEKEQQGILLDIRMKWKDAHKQQVQLPNNAYIKNKKNSLVEQINIHQKNLQNQLQYKEEILQTKEILHIIEKEFYEQHNKILQQKKLEIQRLQLEISGNESTCKELLKKQSEQNIEKKEISTMVNKQQDTFSFNSITNKELSPQEKQFEKRKEHYQKYITQGNLIVRELENLNHKQLLSQDEGNPSCPLCEQNLSASRKRFLKSKFLMQELFLKHRLERFSRLIINLKNKLLEQHSTINSLKKVVDENKFIETQIVELKRRFINIETETKNINKKIEEMQKNKKNKCLELELLQTELKTHEDLGKKELQKSNTKYGNLLARLTTLENEINKIHYNRHEHERAINKLRQIEKQISEYDTVRQQITLQDERKKNIHELCLSLKKIKIQKNELQKKLDGYKNLAHKMKEIREQEGKIAQNLKEITLQKEILLQEKGSLENQKNKLQQLENEHDEQQKNIQKLDSIVKDYQIIASATGKDGIQALLIENAIPEIEQEANNILSRLTNNQAQIIIDSLRDLKKGGTKETLDIKISDPAGIRQYELFSGGEAFRIDFALRIAISKLLARRAGTSLQTLIIDEGFGSQDEEGLSRIMDSIYKIQEDFSKIIIVSHLSSMKDQFPIHFLVEKTPHGSQIQILGQN